MFCRGCTVVFSFGGVDLWMLAAVGQFSLSTASFVRGTGDTGDTGDDSADLIHGIKKPVVTKCE
jgi:hypothetical protein